MMAYMLNIKPSICHKIVGRTHELEYLSEILKRVTQGQPQLVLLSGDAGVGKTKLCRSFVEENHTQQMLVLSGQAILQDQAVSFSLFLDAFRHFFTTPLGIELLSGDFPQTTFTFLLSLLPELYSYFPEVLQLTRMSNQDQTTAFHHILRVLYAMAQAHSGPVVLMLEDLQWADATSLDLLAFLAQRLAVNAPHQNASQPLMVIGTYRTDALVDAPDLQRLLLQLQAQRLACEITLHPLTISEHHQCVEYILDQPLSEEFTHTLFALDEGNPFFTEELVGAIITTGQIQKQQGNWSIPPGYKLQFPSSLSAVILDRFMRLPDADQEVLTYAAVIGRVFDFLLLIALCDMSERELISVLRRAVRIQLISEVVDETPSISLSSKQERYQFRHALTREAIYEQMLVSERRLAHQKVAETIEMLADRSYDENDDMLLPSIVRQHPPAHLLAEHYWLAGMTERARTYALQEVRHARQIFAFREERFYLNMAQNCFPESSSERLPLLHRLGMVSMAVFDCTHAIHWLELAQAGYQKRGQYQKVLRVIADMLLPNWFLAHRPMQDLLLEIEAVVEAVVADPTDADNRLETIVIFSLIAMFWAVGCQFRRANLWIERSMALFATLDDPRKVAAIQVCCVARGWLKTHQHTAIAQEGIAEMRNAIQVARKESLPDVILFGYGKLMTTMIHWGHIDETSHISHEVDDFEIHTGTLRYSFIFGWQRFFAGEHWERGIELLRWDIKRMEQIDVPALVAIDQVSLAHLLLAKNECVEAQIQLYAAQARLECMDQYTYLVPLWWGFAKLSALQGDLLQAEEWYERIFKRWKTTEDTLIILPILLDGITLYISRRNLKEAKDWLAELEHVVCETDNPVGRAYHLEARGRINAQEGKLEDAIQQLRQAVEAWCMLKRYHQQALASHYLAELLLQWSRGRTIERVQIRTAREEAEKLLIDTKTVYERLQITAGVDAVRTLRAATTLDSQEKRRNTLMKRKGNHGLTQREMQVLTLLANGCTNKEIAKALSISIGTAEIHVVHILTKLKCETRTKAAAHAIAEGWVSKA